MNLFGGLNGRFRLWETKEYEEATKVAIFGLEKYRHKKVKHCHLWIIIIGGNL